MLLLVLLSYSLRHAIISHFFIFLTIATFRCHGIFPAGQISDKCNGLLLSIFPFVCLSLSVDIPVESLWFRLLSLLYVLLLLSVFEIVADNVSHVMFLEEDQTYHEGKRDPSYH